MHGGAGAGRCGEGRARRGAGAAWAGWRKPVRWKEAPFIPGAITPQGSLQQQVQGQGTGRLAPEAAGTRRRRGWCPAAPGRHPAGTPQGTREAPRRIMPPPRPSTPSRTPQIHPAVRATEPPNARLLRHVGLWREGCWPGCGGVRCGARRMSWRRPGVVHAPGVLVVVLACLDSQASVRCDMRRPGSCLASWCPGVLVRRPGAWSVLAWRDARPRPLVTAPGRRGRPGLGDFGFA